MSEFRPGCRVVAAVLALTAAGPACAADGASRIVALVVFACLHLGLFLGLLSGAVPRGGGGRSHALWFTLVLLGYPCSAYGVFSVLLLSPAGNLADGADFARLVAGALAVQLAIWIALGLLFYVWQRKVRREYEEWHTRIEQW
ncbi:hypothetical protein OOT46_15630 [Aquabacterium sp. A7-Y]|uniref:hypothetical protein n=1 Tax=Aquabacterium sp. A7-Y TaxID=1349605 RepID=UPI00223DDC45|nr:hypothetical protein [Aquabacterium sp. A7-Y]MCW7539275.1 hypothetical protein [Aquabacterium sp. A7-Y]